jgi:DNA-binding transcriptional LysR family regulator
MELHSLQVFLAVATEKSFSRAAGKLLRTQPAISLSLQRLEQELGEKLIDRSGKDLILTDAGRTVLEYARRFQSLHQEMDNSIAELRDNSAGRLTIGANESTTLYLLKHIERYREMYPKIKVQIRRSLSSKLPNELLDGKLVERNMGVAFLPRMCVEQEIEQKRLCEVRVKEMHVERKIRLIYPTRRALSHAAKAFLEVVG